MIVSRLFRRTTADIIRSTSVHWIGVTIVDGGVLVAHPLILTRDQGHSLVLCIACHDPEKASILILNEC